ncbi:glycosyltransferase family 58 protein [[Candida] arabinofermentans NRRL YB-2248]|uniref:Dol-P-Man:Man(5)GlcNAc(2)-PP-Dol alpha-1,3-mannosyltransferase n=1 Tax=[Candida] arabinofermentans NRRL YB-2248 TaxID=983967 RepID=A0A1E4T3T1_9ASCO|nr:glycosyltransferase family 58 protein [[Candida] arabinofermentans NRRL YB-2248]
MTDELDLQPTATVVPTTKPDLPEFTLENVLADIKFGICSLFNNPEFAKPMAMVILFVESLALKVIIGLVPYTEIDYESYMQQLAQIEAGEFDYEKISGNTGGIVYPGGYVYFYSWMRWLTEDLDDMNSGQIAFRYLYMLTLIFTLAIYLSSGGHNGKFSVKPYILYLICASKRLHSIYVLRLFNDCFTTFFMVATILVLQQASLYKKSNGLLSYILTLLSADLFSVGISIKMNALLYIPAYLVVTYFLCDENLLKLVPILLFGIGVQIGMNWTFLSQGDEIRDHFIAGAFDFNRKFMFQWTVNWKFLTEDVFQSDLFHKGLLASHVTVLALFLFYRWLSPNVTGKSVGKFLKDSLKFWSSTIHPSNVILSESNGTLFVALTMMTCNLIGVLFARSLHYQFLAWYLYSLPLLLKFTNLPGYVNVILFGLHEYCWNKYPTDAISSGLLVSILSVVLLMNFKNDVFASGEANEVDELGEEKKNE